MSIQYTELGFKLMTYINESPPITTRTGLWPYQTFSKKAQNFAKYSKLSYLQHGTQVFHQDFYHRAQWSLLIPTPDLAHI